MSDLPELPEPHKKLGQLSETRTFGGDGSKVIRTLDMQYAVFTADQMRAYALAERERWHVLMRKICCLSDSEMRDGDAARDLCSKAMGWESWDDPAIRSGQETPE